ncbi:MAG: DUF421 domain-containing protein [Peptococcaceae bacterium]|jgi:uncharacterized membrane protein YcaP (DUF421 family)|nr:DUF421 domain-containing protein [Peptococcaceae bacterium]MDH7524657.1 DUF421 domain-containing protein [Peptococcaceae bacterium]
MLILAIRTIILYFLVVLVMRIMGKPQIGQLQPFELVVAIIISELAAVAMADPEVPLLSGIIPIVILALTQITIAYVTLKSERARSLVCGRPSILVEKGTINENELRRLRMNINDLLEQLRVKNFPNISEVDYAIMETNGELSVIPKGDARPVTTKDLGINAPDPGLPLTLVIDGKIINENLKRSGITLKQLGSALQKQGVQSLNGLFFASIDPQGVISWQLKEEAVKK